MQLVAWNRKALYCVQLVATCFMQLSTLCNLVVACNQLHATSCMKSCIVYAGLYSCIILFVNYTNAIAIPTNLSMMVTQRRYQVQHQSNQIGKAVPLAISGRNTSKFDAVERNSYHTKIFVTH